MNRQLGGYQTQSINQKATLSTNQNADIANQIVQNTQTMSLLNVGLQGIKNSVDVKKSIIDYFS